MIGRRAWLAAAAAAALPRRLRADAGAQVGIDGEDLVLRDAAGRELARRAGRDLAGRRHGAPQALLPHAGRRSVVATFPAFDEVWELSLDPAAPPVYDGLVHDWRLGEALGSPGFFAPRRSVVPPPMPARWWLDPAWPWVAGALDDVVLVLHLDVRRVVARLPLPGARVQDSRRAVHDGHELWWLPLDGGGGRWIDPRRWVQAG